MFHHVARCIPPIVENLRSKNVTPNAPDRLVAFLRQPLVSQVLGIIIMNLEGAVMNVGRWRVCTQEEAVVIRRRRAEIEVRKRGHHMFLTVFHDV